MKAISITDDNVVSFKEGSLTGLRKTRQRVYYLLQTYPDLRESDRKLIWHYWWRWDSIGFRASDGVDRITFSEFLKATNPETIRRAAAKIRELFPELRGSNYVQRGRKAKEESYSKKI